MAIPARTITARNAFDAGEFGIGSLANSLTLGCDCLGEIYYSDAHLNNGLGEAFTIPNAVCMHEEDYGITVEAYGFPHWPGRGAPV